MRFPVSFFWTRLGGPAAAQDAHAPDLCYRLHMAKTIAEKLSDLVKAVEALPPAMQEAVVSEFADRLSDFENGALSDVQRREVARRLANPRYADADDVRKFFARYGVNSP